jgi:hypothetical protein
MRFAARLARRLPVSPATLLIEAAAVVALVVGMVALPPIAGALFSVLRKGETDSETLMSLAYTAVGWAQTILVHFAELLAAAAMVELLLRIRRRLGRDTTGPSAILARARAVIAWLQTPAFKLEDSDPVE